MGIYFLDISIHIYISILYGSYSYIGLSHEKPKVDLLFGSPRALAGLAA